jgi:DNA-binding CsgD family transcriptional regulator
MAEGDVDLPAGLAAVRRPLDAARGRERQLRRIFDRSLVPMVMIDHELRIVRSNRAHRLFVRRTLADLRMRRIGELAPPGQGQMVEERWQETLRTGRAAGPHELPIPGGEPISVMFCTIANALPGLHLSIVVPADWPEHELGDLDRDRPSNPCSPLSPRERDVLSLVAAGAGTTEIAAELTVEPSTVKTHLRNAQRKLGARHRAHAIAIAMQNDLLDGTVAGEPLRV